MGTEQVTGEVSAALARTRRQARYLEEATGLGPWSHLVSAGIPVAVGISDRFNEADCSGTVGLILVLSSIRGWRCQRLNPVNALQSYSPRSCPGGPGRTRPRSPGGSR
jgi:hypothetical protein